MDNRSILNLRFFNQKGISAFENFLDENSSNTVDLPIDEILFSDNLTAIVNDKITLEKRSFSNRYLFIQYLYKKISPHHAHIPDFNRNKGLWAWLCLFYLKELCPNNKITGERVKWLLDANNRYYRHIIAGPYLIYHAHRHNPEILFPMLSGKMHLSNNFYKTISEKKEFISNSAIIETANSLYFNSRSKTLKKNYSSKRFGGIYRLITILNQLEVNWDLYSISKENIINLLPIEFDRFIKSNITCQN